jgi:tetratricopeptide (TPR) repeat protein
VKPIPALPRTVGESPDRFASAVDWLAAGDSAAAFSFLKVALARYPDDPRGDNLLGILHYNAGQFDDARAHFARAASLASEVSVYAYNEGLALLMGRRPREAAAAYARSLKGDELLPAAHYWTWAAFNRLGIANEAITRLRQALHNDPEQSHCEPRAQRVELDAITLCVVDCKLPDLAARSMRRSMAQCRFGAAKLLTSRQCGYDGIETIRIDPIESIEDYSRFIMKSLSRYIDTQFALVTQWDGYVINANAWSSQFLDFDYIGARWADDVVSERGSPPSYNIGNGGFSLRSDIFMGAGTDPDITETHPEDTHLCGTYRPHLEGAYGIRYADAEIADRFSFEIFLPESAPFGFHGSFNLSCFESDPKWMRFEFLGRDAFD